MTLDRDRPHPDDPAGPAEAASGAAAAFRRVAGGDLEALGELYDLEADRLYALALWITGSREHAADAVQEVFIRLAAGRDLRSVRSPRAYLLAMARSAAVDRLRSSRGEEPADELVIEATIDPSTG